MTDLFCERIIQSPRKDHRCEQCGARISKGESHHYIAQRFDGDFFAYREHFECRELFLKLRSLRDLYWDEPSDFLRRDELDEDRDWICDEHPIVAERLGWLTPSHQKEEVG